MAQPHFKPSLLATGFKADTMARDVADFEKGQRADRLARLVELDAPPDIWLDLCELFARAYDETLDKVEAGERHPDSLRAIKGMLHTIDASYRMGLGALQRWTRRHYGRAGGPENEVTQDG